MKKNYIGLSLAFTIALSTIAAKAQQITSVEDYNNTLIKNGVAWSSAQGTYNPSFYTGFAPRMEDPNRIHLHLARGNQIRVTVPLDEYSVYTYMYGLKKREALFDTAISQSLIQLRQQNQLASYKAVVNSPKYNVNGLIADLESGRITREQFYQQSLEVLKELNKDRVFHIQLDLTAYIEKWKKTADAFLAANPGSIDSAVIKDPKKTITLINDLLFGRVNLTFVSPEVKAKLVETLNNRNDSSAFEKSALDLLKISTKGRYEFKVLRAGTMQPAIHTQGNSTILEYSEFTAIYPNGSVRSDQPDRDGNTISAMREVGVLNFVERAYHDVDHIRSEPYYGFIPKMDYTAEGNGLHNPAVRTSLKKSIYNNLYADLNIPKTNDTLWVVSRGNVSHGCTRMAAGHILEVREIFPSNAKRMTQVNYFANDAKDYDLFDIDGNGEIEVMGVQYYLAYAIGGDEGEAYREGAGMIPESQHRDQFYTQLYGAKNQFRVDGNTYKFINPYMSQFAYAKSPTGRAAAFSIKMNGEFNLYEQKYEQDKMQFYKMSSTQMSALQGAAGDSTNLGKQMVRLFGRASGCGIFKAEYPLCNEDNFDKELNTLTSKITKVK